MSRASSSGVQQPALPFYDWNVCPGEGCAYGHWTALKPVIIYDTWKQRRQAVAHLSLGEKVMGLTGVVITRQPGLIRVSRDLPALHLKRGDTILTYAHHGEGSSAVWFNGGYREDYDISFTKRPDGSGCGGEYCAATYEDLGNTIWWAKVKLASGRTGWVDMNQAHFDGTCALAPVR